MRSRAIIHVTGPVRSGKTAFIEAVLSSSRWLGMLAARCTMDSTLEPEDETSMEPAIEVREPDDGEDAEPVH